MTDKQKEEMQLYYLIGRVIALFNDLTVRLCCLKLKREKGDS